MHIIFEVIENFEGLSVKGTKKRGNGESTLSKRFTATEVQKLLITKNRLISETTLDMLDEFDKE